MALIGSPASALTDIGWVSSTTILQSMQLALGALNWREAAKIDSKRIAIMNREIRLQEFTQDYWKSDFIPCERKTIAAICALEPYKPKYDEQKGRLVANLHAAFAKQRDMLRCANRWCANLTAEMAKDLAAKEAQAITNISNYAYRAEEERAYRRMFDIYNLKLEVARLGRNLVGQSLQAAGMASSQGALLGNEAGQAAKDSFDAFAYSINRKSPQETQDDVNKFKSANFQQQGQGATAYKPVATAAGQNKDYMNNSQMGLGAAVADNQTHGIGQAQQISQSSLAIANGNGGD